ncbi:sensor histidine kinase [Marinimicrobium agarilyticum]|uniref:sensor histidine kinase n=1 Tax=Marinimicrobium agarilyticum TaxID=306546 RepID=UPI00041E22DA|nr:sensor histidine kinase [Marinimicrobium agarilyticum]
MISIRYRIISFLFVSLLVINIVSGYYIYRHTQEEIEEIFNAQQAQVARTIEQIIADTAISDRQDTSVSSVPDIDDLLGHGAQGHHYEKKIAYQVWDLEGNLLLMSENAPLYPLAATAPGFSRTEYDGDVWHIFSLYSNLTQKWIYTAQKSEARDELIELITGDQLLTMLVVTFLILLVVPLGVILGTRPISVFSREIATRDGKNLDPIALPVSKELYPIKKGVNRLLERIDEALKQEKSFSADLSHELRTPLAAIKVHAQNLELKEVVSDEGRLSLARMTRGVENMSKTIEQLLLLNSIGSRKLELLQEEVGLYDLAKEVLSLLPQQIHRKNEIELVGRNVFVLGNRSLIAALIRNLVENASKYSDEKANIVVAVRTEGNLAVLEVIDSGPGMTNEQKRNSTKRNFRVSDTQTYGSGLGLAITQKIVDLHAGELRFLDREDAQGLVVQVTFRKLDTSH